MKIKLKINPDPKMIPKDKVETITADLKNEIESLIKRRGFNIIK